MSDTTPPAGGSPDPSSTTPPTTTPPSDGGTPPAGGAPTSWLEALPETMRADRNLVKYESLEAFAKGHLNALQRFGKNPDQMLEVPSKPDDAAGWDALWGKLGRPATAKDYQIGLAEGASDADKAFLDGFREHAHKAGLTQGQMEAAVGYFNTVTAKAAADAEAAAKAASEATTAALKSEWGDKFPVYSKEIVKLIGDLGGEGAVEALNADGLGNSKALMTLLAKVVDLRAEPGSLPGAGSGGAGGEALTPYQANAKLAALHGDPAKMAALHDKANPMHAVTLKEREELLKAAYPSGG